MNDVARPLTAVVVALAALGRPCGAQSPSADRIAADIRYLAADAREGRGVGTAGLDSAAHYIARRFAEAGLRPGSPRGYLQAFAIDASAPAAAHAGVAGGPVANVVALLPGRGALAGGAVVIGAHYDHLGRGGFGSLAPDSTGVVHNGADDNASGTAAIVEVARLLAGREAPNHRAVVFVAFTAEELGLIGSTHYVGSPARPLDSTVAMLNLDMVGRLRNGRIAAFGAETAREFPQLVDSLNIAYGLDLAASGDGYGRSDHQSFFAAGVPVLHFFTGSHEDYHRPGDDPEKINVAGIVRIARFVADLAWSLATRDAPLTFVEGEFKQPSVSGGYGAYLGTIPDMTGSPGGVRLSGVRSGSPADSAGIAGGDIIIGIGEFEVADLYDMTDALRTYHPGDTVTVRVRRGHEVLALTATLGRRGG